MVESALKAPEPDLVPLTWALLKALAIQYACLFPLAFGIGWWHRQRPLSRYGVTTAGQPLPSLVAIGLLGFCLVALPFKVLWVVQQHVQLGTGSFWWALVAKSWNPSFWLFFAAGSFVIPPLVEELFFRGYCQSRLEEDFGGASAVVIVALFFVFSHGQYHQASVLSVATILCLVPMALGIGYVYLRTHSLVPCIVLHAALNFPTKGLYDIVLPVVMVVAVVVFSRHWLRAVRDFGTRMLHADARATVGGVVCAVAVAVGFQLWPGVLVPAGLSGLGVALCLEYRQRRLARAIAPPEQRGSP
jgi:membrane protease YdiL (CAAX protease family)